MSCMLCVVSQVVTQGEHRSSSKSLKQGSSRLIAALRQVWLPSRRSRRSMFLRGTLALGLLGFECTCPIALSSSLPEQGDKRPAPPFSMSMQGAWEQQLALPLLILLAQQRKLITLTTQV